MKCEHCGTELPDFAMKSGACALNMVTVARCRDALAGKLREANERNARFREAFGTDERVASLEAQLQAAREALERSLWDMPHGATRQDVMAALTALGAAGKGGGG